MFASLFNVSKVASISVLGRNVVERDVATTRVTQSLPGLSHRFRSLRFLKVVLFSQGSTRSDVQV
jgi:hypothetical protein